MTDFYAHQAQNDVADDLMDRDFLQTLPMLAVHLVPICERKVHRFKLKRSRPPRSRKSAVPMTGSRIGIKVKRKANHDREIREKKRPRRKKP